jgi:hypothetical protein
MHPMYHATIEMKGAGRNDALATTKMAILFQAACISRVLLERFRADVDQLQQALSSIKDAGPALSLAEIDTLTTFARRGIPIDTGFQRCVQSLHALATTIKLQRADFHDTIEQRYPDEHARKAVAKDFDAGITTAVEVLQGLWAETASEWQWTAKEKRLTASNV